MLLKSFCPSQSQDQFIRPFYSARCFGLISYRLPPSLRVLLNPLFPKFLVINLGRDHLGDNNNCRAVILRRIPKDMNGILACLHSRGRLVWFGVASGPVKQIDPSLLAKGSLSLIWAAMVDYVRTRTELLSLSEALFAAVTCGAIKIEIGEEYALRDVAQAHRDIEARRVTGSLVLRP